jgi:hypothetical protein
MNDVSIYIAKSTARTGNSSFYSPQGPFELPQKFWYAFGDSYAAGPGAGTVTEEDRGRTLNGRPCYRSSESYPYILKQMVFATPGSPNMRHVACTGHTTTDVLQTQSPEIIWSDFPADISKTRFTLSIGGNDVGFSRILKACLIGAIKTNCEESKAITQSLVDGSRQNEFRDNLYKVCKYAKLSSTTQ